MDVYEPVIVALEVAWQQASLTIAPEEDAFKEAVSRLDVLVDLPLHEILVEAGAPGPERQTTFEFTVSKIKILDEVDDAFFDAVLEDNPRLFRELSWRRFQVSNAFAAIPGIQEFFVSLNQEFMDSRYTPSMRFSDHYRWHDRSASQMNPDGTVYDAVSAETSLVLDKLAGVDTPTAKGMIRSRFRVHPRHREAFDTMV